MRRTSQDRQAGSKQENEREESCSTHSDASNKRAKSLVRAGVTEACSQLFLYNNKYPPHWNLLDHVNIHYMQGMHFMDSIDLSLQIVCDKHTPCPRI